jgi:fructose-1,6-bisphosphatase/inositol monophosphatase family enzyme
MAAGVILVKEAGGVVTKPDGSPIDFGEPSPVCATANETLHRQLILALNER